MPRFRARARGVGAGIRRTVPSRPPSGFWRGLRLARATQPRQIPRGRVPGAASPPALWLLARVGLARATEPRQTARGAGVPGAAPRLRCGFWRGLVSLVRREPAPDPRGGGLAVPSGAVGELRMPVVWAPATDAHRVDTGVWCGVTIENDELPERAHVLLEACRAAGRADRARPDHGLDALAAVHDPAFLAVLRTAHERWVADGHLDDPGAPYAVAYWFPAVAGRHGGDPARPAATIRAELGRYAMDTMTPVGPGTWEGAKAASDAAATAADLVLGGAPAAYAICRPPGHHAGPGVLRRQLLPEQRRGGGRPSAAGRRRPGGHRRHRRPPRQRHPGLLVGRPGRALRVPPRRSRRGLVPPHGRLRRRGGRTADQLQPARSRPAPPTRAGWARWSGWSPASSGSVRTRVVVSLGVDAAAEDPNSPLEVTQDGFAAAGRLLGQLGRPTVLVHEGGYVLDTLAGHTLAVLHGVEGERRETPTRPVDARRPLGGGPPPPRQVAELLRDETAEAGAVQRHEDLVDEPGELVGEELVDVGVGQTSAQGRYRRPGRPP